MKPLEKILFALLFLVATLLVMLAIGSEDVSAETLTVNDDGGKNYEKVQDAIDAAENGDTIRVWEGTYKENVVVDKSVNLIGNGSKGTTIDGGRSEDVVKIIADWVNMSGFRVAGNESSPWRGIKVESNHNQIFQNICSNNCYGIYLDTSDSNTISYNTINNNCYGIYLDTSDSNTISYNTINNNANGIYLDTSSDCTITNNTIQDNGGNGIDLFWHSDSNIISDNTIQDNGNGICLFAESNTISYNFIKNNSGGIWFGMSSENVILHNKITYNNYGIYLSGSNSTISYNDITFNNYGIFQPGEKPFPSERTENFSISGGGDYPLFFKRITIDPASSSSLQIVKEGEKQTFSIWVKDPEGIEIVNATINTDIGDKVMDMKLVEGTDKQGRWQGSWTTRDISKRYYYLIRFQAVNKNGEYGNDSLFWFSAGSMVSNSTIAHFNNIFGNTYYGIHACDIHGYYINAKHNYWGNTSGPYHPTNNPTGKGDNVTDHVIFNPWFLKNVVVYIDSILPNPAVEGVNIRFEAHSADDENIVCYSWHSSLDGEIYNGTETFFTLSNLSPGEHTIYFKAQDDQGLWSDEVNIILVILKDSDNDTIPDREDAFPNDPAASKDTDDDGYPDEWNEGKTAEDSTTDLKLDEYPNDPDKWQKEDYDSDSSTYEIISFILICFTYVGVMLLIGWAGFARTKKRKKEFDEKMASNTTFSQQPLQSQPLKHKSPESQHSYEILIPLDHKDEY